MPKGKRPWGRDKLHNRFFPALAVAATHFHAQEPVSALNQPERWTHVQNKSNCPYRALPDEGKTDAQRCDDGLGIWTRPSQLWPQPQHCFRSGLYQPCKAARRLQSSLRQVCKPSHHQRQHTQAGGRWTATCLEGPFLLPKCPQPPFHFSLVVVVWLLSRVQPLRSHGL